MRNMSVFYSNRNLKISIDPQNGTNSDITEVDSVSFVINGAVRVNKCSAVR